MKEIEHQELLQTILDLTRFMVNYRENGQSAFIAGSPDYGVVKYICGTMELRVKREKLSTLYISPELSQYTLKGQNFQIDYTFEARYIGNDAFRDYKVKADLIKGSWVDYKNALVYIKLLYSDKM